jgi:hypothetical protein
MIPMNLRLTLSTFVLLLALPLAGCNTLQQIEIIPGAGVQVLSSPGQTAQFRAIATTQLGGESPKTQDVTHSVSWASSTPSVATIDASGLATAFGPGKTIITAQSGGITATSDLTVTVASGSGGGSGGSGGAGGTASITVTPAVGTASATFDGETAQFLATGSLTGGTPQDLTNSVHWLSSNVAVATIDQNGLATAVGSGKTVITAQSGGLTGSSDLTVASTAVQPPVTLTVIPGTGATGTFAGETTQFLAIGNLSGGGPKDVTRNVQWISSDASVATINQTGLATAVGANTTSNQTTITALGTTPTGTAVIANSIMTVVPSQGTSGPPMLTLIPGTALSAVNGETTQFLALGNLAGGGPMQDLTGSVRWVSSDPLVATVDQNGLATAVGGNSVASSTTITAMATSTAGNAITATSTLTVQPSNGYAIQPTLAVIPASAITSATGTTVGETAQFIAIGNLSGGGRTQDLTNRVRWVSSDVAVATINQAGLATAVGALGLPSSSTITAIATTTSGSVLTATGTMTMVPGGTVNLPTLTVYKVGLGNGTVTSSPAGLSCGPQAACTGNFQLNATVTLTATPAAGSSFAGWSANCTPTNSSTCTLTMGNNDTVGAIFNVP